jgi:hypothetical protein
VCRAQTIIDILVRHAFDNRVKFTALHQSAIEKLCLNGSKSSIPVKLLASVVVWVKEVADLLRLG